MSYINDDQMQPLAVLSEKRSPYLPDVPTFKEVTGVNNLCFAARVLAAAPGLPQEKYDVLAKAIEEASSNPEYMEKETSGSNEIWDISGEDLQAFLKTTEQSVKDVEYWKSQDK
jgi:tripartite-type tricarboxylate transporter receptor subunit TctC